MRVLVVGGTRFIGKAITRELLMRGHAVTLLHRGRTPNEFPRAHAIHGDRMAPGEFERAIRDAAPDAIVDMIALTPADSDVTVRAIHSTSYSGAFLMISSADVYMRFGEIIGTEEPGASGPGEYVSEDSPLRGNLYPYRGRGLAEIYENYDKILVERHLAGYPGTRVLRLPMVFGPGDPQRRIQLVLEALKSDEPPKPQARWSWRAPYSFVDNCAAAAADLIEPRVPGGVAFHIQDAAPTERMLWQAVAAAAGLPVPEIAADPDEPEPPVPPDLLLDTSMIDSVAPTWKRIPFEEGIRRTVAGA